MIYWANDVYPFGEADPHAHGCRAIHFFPDNVYAKLHLGQQLPRGMAWHFAFMWLFLINGLLYVGYTAVSGEWRYLLPRRDTLANAWGTVLHDLHLSKHAPPFDKYNGAQRIAYTAVILMGGGSLITGLAIYKPAQMAWLAHALGGYGWARAEHFYLTLLYVVFFVLHITQVVRAGWNNFRSIVSGYEIIHEPIEEVPHAPQGS